MAVSYKGVQRVVEPYSLVFKTRTDGVGQEYLYVHDRTGGRSSGPGLKTFLHNSIDSMEILEDTFDPKYEVTLAKSGDADRTGVFTGNRGARFASYSGHGRRPAKPKPYAVSCPRCGRVFRRTTRSLRLNEHKDTYGYRCGARSGYRA